ncbi:MAG: DUF2069 domain-containing protein [Gammaproteobacteria bacterium]|nr:DUF2069 domain-containing protein [Pseudomonadales bacterium]MCP5345957.1 DUF2069 domain-containing protein [Pseudomonadales bacterium]
MKPLLLTELPFLRKLVLTGFYGLLLSLFFNSLAMTTGLTLTTLVFWLLQSLPLLPFAPGLHRSRIRYHAWLSFVVLMYFVHAVLSAFTPGKLIPGLAEVFFCSLLFVALILFIRRKARGGQQDS